MEVSREAPDAGTRLVLGSVFLLTSSLLWVVSVLLDVIGPVGPVTAGLTSWAALLLDLAGVILLAVVYLGLASATTGRPRAIRRAIAWAFVLWVVLSATWRFVLPPAAGSNAQDLFSGFLGAYPQGLDLAIASMGLMELMFALWVAASVLFVAVHVLMTVDYHQATEEDWVRGLPVYAWLVAAGASLVGTLVIVDAILPVLGGGLLGDNFTIGTVLKLLVAPNLFISGYAASLRLGLDVRAAEKAAPGA